MQKRTTKNNLDKRQRGLSFGYYVMICSIVMLNYTILQANHLESKQRIKYKTFCDRKSGKNKNTNPVQTVTDSYKKVYARKI